MYKRILLAYDGSTSGQKALLDCQDLAQWSQASITLVAVTPLSLQMVAVEGGIYDTNLADLEKERFEGVLAEGLRRLKEAGYQASGDLLLGDTVTEITRYAERINADLIVVGHQHHDSWAARWWRGSVSKSLIEHASCSVLVVITR